MTSARIPLPALLLGLAGTLPFLWGLATLWSVDVALWTKNTLHPRLLWPTAHVVYGTVILAFMSGVLWGFATKAKDSRAAVGYGLSVLPALWAFFLPGGSSSDAAISLMLGFAALICIDALFSHWGLTPAWWMKLRILLTAIVVASLALGVIV